MYNGLIVGQSIQKKEHMEKIISTVVNVQNLKNY